MHLNPNHPVSKIATDDFFQKLMAILVHKNGGELVISLEDIRQHPSGVGMSIREEPDGIYLKTMTLEEAMVLAKKEGGMVF